MDLSVVIVSYNSRDELDRSLASVAPAADGLSTETIVVDNASGDGSADHVRAAFADVRVIANEDNRGFSQACNQGLAASSGDHVLFLNPDTVCRPGSLTALVQRLRGDPGIGAIGPRLLAADGTPSRSCFRFHTLWRPTLHLPVLRWISGERLALHYPPEHPSIRDGGSVDWISGACLLARRAALEQVGGFDERYFMYFDDTDLCHRLAATGWGIVYAPDVEVIHHGAQSSKRVWGRMLVEMQRSRLVYLSKHHGFWGRLVLRFLILAAAVLRSAAWLGRGRFSRLRTEVEIIRVALAGP